MFHFSSDRLAGLDTMILKVTASPKVPTLIHSHSLHHDTYMPVRKPKKQKPHRETRPPLVDKTASNNLAPRPPHPTSSMFLDFLSAAGEAKLFSHDRSSPRAPCPSDTPSFRPLPPLPSASVLQLPSFLNISTQSFTPLADPPPPRSTASLPASALFRVSPSPVASSRHAVARKTKNNKVFEGPQWIPAFHHPNSPYVPWPSPVRRHILPPPSPLPPSPVCPCSPCIRPGAVAPDPWASSSFSQALTKSGKNRLSSSWKSFRNSIKKGVKTAVSQLGKSRNSPSMLCASRDLLHIHDDTDTAAAVPHLTSNAVRSTLPDAHSRGSRDSLASSFAPSDSRTLVTWLAERRASASGLADNVPREMSVGEYELMGSWLDLRHRDGEWVCGIQYCDMHTAGRSPHAVSQHPGGLRTAMPSDCADMLSVPHSSPTAPALAFPSGPLCAPPRSHSLPRLPCQSFDIYAAQEVKLATAKKTERCLARELSMPGGWTFTS